MKYIIAAGLLALSPISSFAQDSHSGMNHDEMDHSNMASGETMATGMEMSSHPATQAGQSAFAAIEEIVLALEADPNTDWSKVNITGLRDHLVDMELVFTDADLQTKEVGSGFEYTISGSGKTIGAIQRMVIAHSGIMNGAGTRKFTPAKYESGVVLSVSTTADDMDKLRAIGFFGLMALGMHHQDHHWMMATGSNPHH